MNSRTEYLKQLATSALAGYEGGMDDLETLTRDFRWILRSLDELADPVVAILRPLWGRLEILYSLALDESRTTLSADDEAYIRETLREIRDAIVVI